MILIDGKKEATLLKQNLKKEVSELEKKFKKVPGLAVILVGNFAPSLIYVKNKISVNKFHKIFIIYFFFLYLCKTYFS